MKARNKYSFGAASTRRKETVSRYIQITADRAISCSPIDFGVPWMGGAREDEEQHGIFLDGHSKCDGYEKISYHQKKDDKGKGKALDLAPYIVGEGFSYKAPGRSGIIGMLMLEAWEELQDEGLIPEDLYLHWGGLWTHRDPRMLGWDMWHFEIRDYEQIEKV